MDKIKKEYFVEFRFVGFSRWFSVGFIIIRSKKINRMKTFVKLNFI